MFPHEGRLDSQPQDWYAQPTVRSSWELVRDWGYRLEPEFALMFASQKPQKEVEHLLLVPDDEEPPSDEEVEPGVEVMGMEDMLSSARLEGSKASMELFIKGQTLDGNLVRFDPIRDSCDVPLGNFVLSYDIDSINVMAHRLKVLGDVEIEVLPYSGQRPPSPKSNQTYVELLMPQSEEDLQSGRRLEWFSTRHSVVTIPHTHFGKIGYFKISIHFPRMKHKDPITNWTVTLNPWEVQSLFLTEVLYPAIIAGENPSTLPYKDYMLDEWKWKAANNTRLSGASRTITVTVQQFPAIQIVMHKIIVAGSDKLGFFASCYLLMDAKGIKQHTNCVIRQDDMNTYETLCAKVNYLDFECLKKKENGQLVMDLGPHRRWWRTIGVSVGPSEDLEVLQSSWYATGEVHNTNTMANFGGHQTEMSQTRTSLVQICS